MNSFCPHLSWFNHKLRQIFVFFKIWYLRDDCCWEVCFCVNWDKYFFSLRFDICGMTAVEKCGGEFHFPSSLFSTPAQSPSCHREEEDFEILKCSSFLHFILANYLYVSLMKTRTQFLEMSTRVWSGPKIQSMDPDPHSTTVLHPSEIPFFFHLFTISLWPCSVNCGQKLLCAIRMCVKRVSFKPNEKWKHVSQINPAFSFRFKVSDDCN